MFAWLRKWFGQDDFDQYRPRERLIYQYFNGREAVRADPMLLYKKLMEVGPELDIDIKVANSPSKDANKAYESMVAKIRQVFDLKPLADGGLTETETVELLDHFIRYNESIKKKVKTSPTSSTSLAASATANSATNGSTACGSAASVASTSRPKSSLTEPVSPSAP